MDRPDDDGWRTLATSTLDWWSLAGVDVLTDDAPRNWLAPPAPSAAAVAATAAAPVAAAPGLPDTLEAFLAWRLGDGAPDAGRGQPVPPEGMAGAPLTIVVDWPEGGAMLGGAAGRLFDRMLGAIGLSRDSVYITALSHARPTVPRLTAEDIAALAPLAQHHLALARPTLVWALGDAAGRALGGTDGAGDAGSLRMINLDGREVAYVAGRHPRILLERCAMKAPAWRQLVLIKGELQRCAPGS